jgi:potassium-transporting ATPase potassium-binding subunit
MGTFDFIQVFLILFTLLCISPPLGAWIAKVFEGERHSLSFLYPIETSCYRLAGINPAEAMNWKKYASSLLWFSGVSFLIVFLIQLFQAILPLNPQHLPGVSWHLAINTAVSFMTNTNWQAYGGESTLSYFTQMIALTVQNFASAGAGMAVLLALARGIRQKESQEIGNFWVDMVRSIIYVLLPLSILLAVILMSQGVIQNLSPYLTAKTLEGRSQV